MAAVIDKHDVFPVNSGNLSAFDPIVLIMPPFRAIDACYLITITTP
jgi:hypothetical protein